MEIGIHTAVSALFGFTEGRVHTGSVQLYSTATVQPVSSHPIKKPDIYIEEARRLRLRLNGLYNLYNTSG